MLLAFYLDEYGCVNLKPELCYRVRYGYRAASVVYAAAVSL